VIVAVDTPSIRAAKAASTTNRLFVSGRPGEEWVCRLNRPGGNMTGVTTLSTELPTKRLDVRRKIVPNAMTVAYLTSPVPGPPTAEEQTSKVLAAAGALGQQVIVVEVRNVPTVG
jgi:putative ABC transport system substrate-binding protein